ncbi:MAG: cysteine--tRNA ligase [Minisyncoccota bacterium]
MIHLHNTLGNKLEEFKPLKPGHVSMYHCGPTVYGEQHIGNLSMFVFTDILRRTMEYDGLEVKQVINFTDFGHLSSDADEGEDKMTKGLKQEGLSPTLENMKKMGEKYAQLFLEDITKLNVEIHNTNFPYASNYIAQQIELIKTLEEKGFAYQTSDGLYFDISKYPEYGKLGNVNMNDTSNESRVGLNSEKRNPRDFALWKFNPEVGWQSPWGQGFPGWHIECSAMIITILGPQIDIHTGGIEHIAVHHNNEIAQSESATGISPFSKFWLHRAHLQINDSKIAKSEGNVIYLKEIIDRGFSPLIFRYLLLGSHYKTPTNFTWEALTSAENAYRKLKEFFATLPQDGKISDKYKKEFKETIENDLNTPEALAVVWKLVKDDSLSLADKRATLLNFDQVLGLNLENNEYEIKNIPEEIKKLLNEREEARNSKDFKKSDELRDQIKARGFEVKDTEEGQKLHKIN